MSENKEIVKSYDLRFPVEVGGNKYDRLEFQRRPIVSDMLAANTLGGGDEGKNQVCLFANLCGVEPDVIKALDWKDFQGLSGVYEVFTG